MRGRIRRKTLRELEGIWGICCWGCTSMDKISSRGKLGMLRVLVERE